MSREIRRFVAGPLGLGRWRSRRRRGGIVAAVAATLLLASSACSGSGSGSGGNGPVTLTYGLWDVAQKPAMEQIIKEFHASHPDINVKIQLTPFDSYWTKLQTAVKAGTGPDVFWMNTANAKLYAINGAILDLDDQIKSSDFDMNNYVDSIRSAYTVNGKVYGIPKDVNGMGLCYNKKLFQQAGVKPPDASWTWNDLISAAKKLTDAAKNVYGFAAPNDDELGWYLTVLQSGGWVISPDGKTSGYDQPGTIEGIQFWTDMINKHHVSPTLQQTTDTDPEAMLTSGKVAMRYCGSWEPEELATVPYGKANLDVAPLPKGPAGNRDFYSNGLANVIAAKTKYPRQAWEFVQFLGSKQAAQIQAKTGTVIPAFKGQASEYAKAMPQYHLQVFIDALPNSKPFPASENSRAWSDYMIQQFATAWTGKSTVADVAHEAATKMNQALAAEQH
jgi:multiple sugar transport system substrate-binding protein